MFFADDSYSVVHSSWLMPAFTPSPTAHLNQVDHRLKSISDAHKCLKKGIIFEELDKKAKRYTDNEMAKKVQVERSKLFDKILQVA